MNILPKKSWHVRNKDNIERVRRDEENAANEEKEKERRVALAESEARIDELRLIARKRKGCEDVDEDRSASVSNTTFKNVNLFEDLEAGDKVAKKNKQHEDEARQEKEKQEKAIGLLTYLGQGSSELEGVKPWYCVPNKSKVEKAELDLKKKKHEDPLLTMNKYLEATEKYDAAKSGQKIEKKRKVSSQASVSKSKNSGQKSIEQLRKERLEREKVERMKQQQLLNKVNNVVEKEPVYDERTSKYFSQFCPDIARR